MTTTGHCEVGHARDDRPTMRPSGGKHSVTIMTTTSRPARAADASLPWFD